MEGNFKIIVTDMEETVGKKVGFNNVVTENSKNVTIEKEDTFVTTIEKEDTFVTTTHFQDSYQMPTTDKFQDRKQNISPNYSRIDGSKMENSDFEINRLNQKCKSYQYEVARLNSIHEEEIKKLRVRIKILETGVKKLDTLSSQCFYMFTDLYGQSCKAIENLAHCRNMNFTKPVLSRTVDEFKNWLNDQSIRHFVKQRRIFTNTEDLLDGLNAYSYNDLQSKFDENLYMMEQKNYDASLRKSSKHSTTEITQNIILEDKTYNKNQIHKLFEKNDMGSLFREFSYQFALGNGFTGLIEILNDTLLKFSNHDYKIDFKSSYYELEKLLENIQRCLEKRDENDLEDLKEVLEKKKQMKSILIDFSDIAVKKETLLKEVEELEKLKDQAFHVNQQNELTVENQTGKKNAINNLLNFDSSSQLDLQRKKNQIDQELQNEKKDKISLQEKSDKLKLELEMLKQSTESINNNNKLVEKIISSTNNDLEHWRKLHEEAELKKDELDQKKESYSKELQDLKKESEEQNRFILTISSEITIKEKKISFIREDIM